MRPPAAEVKLEDLKPQRRKKLKVMVEGTGFFLCHGLIPESRCSPSSTSISAKGEARLKEEGFRPLHSRLPTYHRHCLLLPAPRHRTTSEGGDVNIYCSIYFLLPLPQELMDRPFPFLNLSALPTNYRRTFTALILHPLHPAILFARTPTTRLNSSAGLGATAEVVKRRTDSRSPSATRSS